MKRQFLYATALAVAVSLPVADLAFGESGEEGYSGSISVGAVGKDIDDSGNRAAEFTSTDTSHGDLLRPVMGAELAVSDGDLSLDVGGHYYNSEEQGYEGAIEFKRIFDIEADYQEYWHRLPQDELLHIQATSAAPGQGAQLWHSYTYAPTWDVNSNTAPDMAFGIQYSDFEAKGLLRIPQIPGLRIGVANRIEKRHGTEQVMGMSKCGSCHVVAHEKEINETTRDIKPFIQWDMGQLSLEYSFLKREFTAEGEPVMQKYDLVENPLTGAGSEPGGLYGRVNYGNLDGELEIDRTPDSEKEVHTVKAKYDMAQGHSLSAGYVNSTVTNTNVDEITGVANGGEHEELEEKLHASMLNYSAKLSKNLFFNLSGRMQTLKSDVTDVDLKANYKGDEAGNDFQRISDLPRDDINAKAGFKYRMGKGVTLLAGYEYDSVEREHADFLVSEDTTTHTLNAKANMRMSSRLSFMAGYTYTMVNDPYTMEDVAYPTHIDLGTDDDGKWDGIVEGKDGVQDRTTVLYTYTDYVYDQRTHEMSATPETEHEVNLKANWMAADTMFVSAYGRYSTGENSQDLFYDYTDDTLDAGIDLTVTPSNKMSLTFGYNYFLHETDSQFYIPYYHG